jgi:molybdate transport system permease protein
MGVMSGSLQTCHFAMRQPRDIKPASRFVIGAAAFLALLFLALPIITLAFRGVASAGQFALPDTGIPEAVSLSLFTTLASSLITLLAGTPLAFVLARYQFPFKRVANLLVELPIVLPPAVAGLALLLTFGRRGLLGASLNEAGITLSFTTAAVILAQIFVAAPFYIRSASIGFQGVPRDLEDAARVDGASEGAVFWYITLRLARRSIAAGLILSWARALGEFGATILFAGSLQGITQTMPLLVYNILERDVNAAIFTGVLLTFMAAGALLISQQLYKADDEA